MARKRRFQGRRIDSTCLRWAFCPAKHGWKSFLTLTSFLAKISDFKNLKGTWHQMLARSRHLQGIFGLLKPFLHVQILICFVDVYQNHGVQDSAPAERFHHAMAQRREQINSLCLEGGVLVEDKMFE